MTTRELEARLLALERRVPGGSVYGAPGISTAFGAASVVYRDHFPAELTSAFSSTTGYSWQRRVLDRVAAPSFVNPTVTDTGQYAFTPDNDTTLVSGTQGYLFAEPNAGGWVFVKGGTGSLTVEEVDGSPSIAGATKLQFDQADGFVVSNPSGSIAKVKLTSVALTHQYNTLNSDYTITAVSTFETVKNAGVDVSISLVAGTWIVYANLSGKVDSVAGGAPTMYMALYNSTAAAYLAGGIGVVLQQINSDGTTYIGGTGALILRAVISGTSTIKLQALYNGTAGTVYSDAVGVFATHIGALKIA